MKAIDNHQENRLGFRYKKMDEDTLEYKKT